MVPSRRQSNGRSPLVNQKHQITAFFSKSATPSPSPSPMISKQTSKLNPKPSPTRIPSSSPTTPPVQSKAEKALLVVVDTALAPNVSYGDEVVDKRIKVYSPLDKVWYEGSVKSFDKESGKHLVQYDDADEEFLDLRKGKIQWIEEGAKRLKRLSRGSSLACEKLLLEAEEEQVVEGLEDKSDDSTDEDWGKKISGKTLSKNDGDDTDLIDEEEEKEVKQLRKRKVGGGDNLGHGKKGKSKGGLKVSACGR